MRKYFTWSLVYLYIFISDQACLDFHRTYENQAVGCNYT